MAISLLSHVVSDLCLGKPALKSLSISSTVGDALLALKTSEDDSISVWNCDHHHSSSSISPFSKKNDDFECRCVGKICMADIICYLCKDENLSSPSSVLQSPVSVILPKNSELVKHVEPSSSLIKAIDLILQGAHNLVVPIQSTTTAYSRKKQPKAAAGGPTFHCDGRQYCWITQDDVMRFILSRIGLFSPLAALSLEFLGIIRTDILAIDCHAPASMALEAISRSLGDQTSVAVVDDDGCLVSEISPFTLSCCDETLAAAIVTLSCADLIAYIDWGGPPDDLVRVVKSRLRERKLEGILAMLDNEYLTNISSPESFPSSSSDDELSTEMTSPPALLSRSRRYNRSGSYSARMSMSADAIICHPWSSLVAIMIQAIAHRVNYVWVVEDDGGLAGIVVFRDMLKVFREHLQSMADEWGDY
ncbi:hypothetical protein Nepgr_007491 [Nepenthes gracilis]|uniref:CBS domain-containing protein n=1 Tax=Nepenthes gracilis TaxID=150966 RepID=A0AAD3S7B4_NEPGR|nr:hypothetical protein Nepgr_007491 [Nepenthes gracilis]